MKFLKLILIMLVFIGIGCKTTEVVMMPLNDNNTIDYSDIKFWAAHPDIIDNADKLGGTKQLSDQSELPADVFFVYPTIFTSNKATTWNADIHDKKLNEQIDNTTIQFQASAFNKGGRIFAPRYRQAHIKAYYAADKMTAKSSFELAYNDVKAAFEYYMQHHNNGRPIVIASHSQGSTHCIKLVKEYFDGKDLSKQLVAAYLIGMPVAKDHYTSIKPCEDVTDTGCVISWRTYRRDHKPGSYVGDKILVTNPLSWKTDKIRIDKSKNKGGVMRNIKKTHKNIADAQVEDGVLWTVRPKFPMSFLFTRKNYHIADINLYYVNIRENVVDRVEAFVAQ